MQGADDNTDRLKPASSPLVLADAVARQADRLVDLAIAGGIRGLLIPQLKEHQVLARQLLDVIHDRGLSEWDLENGAVPRAERSERV